MKVTGFSFIRNALIYDYPIVEAIQSILPLCDDFVVAVGQSDDDTVGLIQSIDPYKVRILHTQWDDSLRKDGQVLAIETNRAFQAIGEDADWAFYIQGDEVLHEKYHDIVRESMHQWKDHPRVDGLLFNYMHFYGSYDYIGSSPRWYPREVRIVRNDKSIYSYADAQGFKKGKGKRLRVKPLDAFIYHYGWVKDPRAMQRKRENFEKYWHTDQWIDENVLKAEEFDYSNVDSLAHFRETHPLVMQKRIESKNWTFDYDLSFNRDTLKNRIKKFTIQHLGINPGRKNFRVI